MNVAVAKVESDSTSFNIEAIRREFPILNEASEKNSVHFLDSGASAQKPDYVLKKMDEMYRTGYANVHRGAYTLSQLATDAYEGARKTVATFLNAESVDEIIFTRSATGAINLVAGSFGRAFLEKGDEIIISEMEHHANIVPWQLLGEATGSKLKVIPVDQDGNISIDTFQSMLTNKTKLVAVTHMSNVLGTIVPVRQIVELAHANGTAVMIDGAQGVVHSKVDVQELGADFYVFTGHKLYGPSGVGVLYGKKELLNKMPPYEGGGDMIEIVTFEKSTYRDAPTKFEAGTPPIVEAVGLAAAIEYIENIGQENIAIHEDNLLKFATSELQKIPGLSIFGLSEKKAGIISFNVEGIHSHDLSTILDSRGVSIRAGHHCAQPLMKKMGVEATARASLGLYNNKDDIVALAEGIKFAKELLT